MPVLTCDTNFYFSVDVIGRKRNEEPISGDKVEFSWTDR
jgi:hypothetical protein